MGVYIGKEYEYSDYLAGSGTNQYCNKTRVVLYGTDSSTWNTMEDDTTVTTAAPDVHEYSDGYAIEIFITIEANTDRYGR